MGTRLCSVRVATDADFRSQITAARPFELISDFDAVGVVLQVGELTPMSAVRRLVAQRLRVQPSSFQQRFWQWVERPGGTYRPCAPVPDEALVAGLVRPGSTPPVVDLFLELAQPHEALPPYNPSTDMLILIKVYRGASASQPLECKGHLVASRPMPLRAQLPEMRRVAGLPSLVALEAYKEVRSAPTAVIDRLSLSVPLRDAPLESGDIVVLSTQGAAPNPQVFFCRAAEGRAAQHQQTAAPLAEHLHVLPPPQQQQQQQQREPQPQQHHPQLHSQQQRPQQQQHPQQQSHAQQQHLQQQAQQQELQRQELQRQELQLEAHQRDIERRRQAEQTAAQQERQAWQAREQATEVRLKALQHQQEQLHQRVLQLEGDPGACSVLSASELELLLGRLEESVGRVRRLVIERRVEEARAEAQAEATECAICNAAPKDTRLSCGHLLCRGCSNQLVDCPVCRRPVMSREHAYL